MHEFYYHFLLIMATWDIASAAIGLEPIGHNLSKIYNKYKNWAVEWAVGWPVGLATGWPPGGFRGGGQGGGQGVPGGPPSPWGAIDYPATSPKNIFYI